MAETDSRSPKPADINWELLRILVMGGVLAGLLYVVFFHRGDDRIHDPTYVPIQTAEPRVPVPELDHEILAQVQDDNREQRLIMQAKPLRHLLEKSLDIVPTVAAALGMPEDPVPVSRVRNDKSKFRGRYLWFKGRLESLSPPGGGHPVSGYSVYEATIRTEADEPVMFAFSIAPDPSIEIGDWVRVEGFFLKLRDTADGIAEAPMLVGPRLFRDYSLWDPVTSLDPTILDEVKDGLLIPMGDGRLRFEATPDSERVLDEDQAEPLWHLASYALNQKRHETRAEWRKLPAISDKETWLAIRNGAIEKGTPMRILGEFIQARTIQADVNPIGVTHWTEAWIRVSDLGGKLIAVWVPGEIEDIVYGTSLEVRGHFYKRHTYQSRTLDEVITAVFVAPELHRYTREVHPMAQTVAWSFAGLIVVIVIVFFFMARKDRRITQRNEAALIRRRRKRRERAMAGSTP